VLSVFFLKRGYDGCDGVHHSCEKHDDYDGKHDENDDYGGKHVWTYD
jgi:hypothetical protein